MKIKQIIVLVILCFNLHFNRCSAQFFNINAHPNCSQHSSTLYSVFADSVTNKLYYGGGFTSTDGITCPGIAYYDFQTMQANIIPDTNLFFGNDFSKIIRIDSFIYVVGEVGYKIGNNTSQFYTYLKTDGVNWHRDIQSKAYGQAYDILKRNDTLLVAGTIDTIGGVATNMIAGEANNSWFAYPYFSITSNAIKSLQYYHNELYVCGNFDGPAQDIAQFDGVNWNQLAGGISGGWTGLNKMIEFNGKLIVAGLMQLANGDPGDCIAAWDGVQWSPMGSGVIGQVFDLAVYNGELYASGAIALTTDTASFIGLLKWDGVNWHPVDSSYFDGTVFSMSIMGSSMYLGGVFEHIDGIPFQNLAEYKKPVGIKEHLKDLTINVFPNPAKEKCTINFPSYLQNEKVTIQLMNSLGEIVYSKRTNLVDDSYEINLANINNGIYQIIFRTNTAIATRKIVINK